MKENTLLLLSSLANEFSWKVSICDKGGLVLLLDCLQSEDPDIVKNALQTMALVLQVGKVKKEKLENINFSRLVNNNDIFNDAPFYMIYLFFSLMILFNNGLLINVKLL